MPCPSWSERDPALNPRQVGLYHHGAQFFQGDHRRPAQAGPAGVADLRCGSPSPGGVKPEEGRGEADGPVAQIASHRTPPCPLRSEGRHHRDSRRHFQFFVDRAYLDFLWNCGTCSLPGVSRRRASHLLCLTPGVLPGSSRCLRRTPCRRTGLRPSATIKPLYPHPRPSIGQGLCQAPSRLPIFACDPATRWESTAGLGAK